MIQLKRNSFYNFFPLLSIISLASIRLIELNYPSREPQLFRQYLFFNILFPVFYGKLQVQVSHPDKPVSACCN